MFRHADFEGERRALYPVWEQPDVGKRGELPVSLSNGAAGRPANSVAKRSGDEKDKSGSGEGRDVVIAFVSVILRCYR